MLLFTRVVCAVDTVKLQKAEICVCSWVTRTDEWLCPCTSRRCWGFAWSLVWAPAPSCFDEPMMQARGKTPEMCTIVSNVSF